MWPGWAVSIRTAFRVNGFDRPTCKNRSCHAEQAAVRKRIKEICETHVGHGYRRVYLLLDREGWGISIMKD